MYKNLNSLLNLLNIDINTLSSELSIDSVNLSKMLNGKSELGGVEACLIANFMRDKLNNGGLIYKFLFSETLA